MSTTDAAGPVRLTHLLELLRSVRPLLWAQRTTPARMRITRLVLVATLLVATVAAGWAAATADGLMRDIDVRSAPVSTSSLVVYRALAEADAGLVGELLAPTITDNGTGPGSTDERLEEAGRALAMTASQAGDDVATTDRVGDITADLSTYAGLAEQARAISAAGGDPSAALRGAGDLMGSSILPTAEAVQAAQARQLDRAYADAAAESLPVPAFVAAAVAVLTLAAGQVFLFRSTRRVFTRGTLLASVAVLLLAGWWVVAGTAAGNHLAVSRSHQQSITDALGPAQVAVAQARAAEGRALITDETGAAEAEFDVRIELLARDDGVGGALGAARALATDATSAAGVDTVLDAVRTYREGHDRVRELVANGNLRGAILAAVSRAPDGSGRGFARLRTELAKALAYEQRRFTEEIAAARAWRAGLVTGIAVLGGLAVVGAAWGLSQRLAEYR